MMKKLVCLAMLPLTWPLFASAEEWRFGLMSEVEFLSYQGVKRDVNIYPLIYYEGDRFYIEGDEAGVYFFKSEDHQLSLGVNYDWQSFTPKDSNNWQMKQLNKRKSSIMVNVDYTLVTPYGALSTELSTDILGRHKGITLDVGYTAMLEIKDVTLVPNLGITKYSGHYNNYYYGISDNEAKRSGLSPYKSKAGVNPYAELNLIYKAMPQWEMTMTGRYEHLSRQIKNSPMVNKKESMLLKLGILYQF